MKSFDCVKMGAGMYIGYILARSVSEVAYERTIKHLFENEFKSDYMKKLKQRVMSDLVFKKAYQRMTKKDERYVETEEDNIVVKGFMG